MTRFQSIVVRPAGSGEYHERSIDAVKPDGTVVQLAEVRKYPRPSNPDRVKVNLVYRRNSASVKAEVERVAAGNGHGSSWKPSKSLDDAVKYITRFYGLKDLEVVHEKRQYKKRSHSKAS